LASNHLSFLDHFILGATTRRQIFYISKAQHFDKPVRRFFFTRWGVIPLQRGEGDKEAFQRSVDVLKAGHLYAIYPEGTRSLDGKLHKGHTGVARLHLLTGAPVIPVAMKGTFAALPKGKSVPKLKKCGVTYGKPLDFTKFKDQVDDRATLKRITHEIMMAIRDISGQEYVDEYQYNPEVKSHARTNGHAVRPDGKPRSKA
jgi:1-acyl-sn-glycerol-3-phosphate acyltransferase